MVKHTQTIFWLLPTNCLSVFDHFMGLALKGLTTFAERSISDLWQSPEYGSETH